MSSPTKPSSSSNNPLSTDAFPTSNAGAKVGPTTIPKHHTAHDGHDASNHTLPMPGLSGKANGHSGNLVKGPVDEHGKLKDAALMVGIKVDLEAEVHLTARVRGDIVVGLYS